ncbi:MAG: metallophosphoesterase [Candidatus Woesearchaeota archaeon]|jgi:DNA repair exonuclease SbcCD nuclease subunit|nr:metallophosphoesterase [Candidatus Woesearchaeota archaeon]
MYKRIAITGDLHIRAKFPYFESSKQVLTWIVDNEVVNNEDTLFINLGDIYDQDINNGELNRIVLDFLSQLKNKDKILLNGNHDSDTNTTALEALRVINGVEVISEMDTRIIEDKNFLLLPHIYTDREGITMEENYSSITINEPIDYCLFHVMTEKMKFHKKAKVCDLSNLNIKQRIGGHNHNYDLDQGGDYLGSLQPNSSTEKDKTPKIYIIDLEKGEDYTIDVPLFINYYTVTYPDALPEMNVEYPIINILDSLDRKEAVEYYMKEAKEKDINLTINRVFRRRLMNDKEEVENEKGKTYTTDSEYFNQFEKEKEVSSGVSTIIRRVINL